MVCNERDFYDQLRELCPDLGSARKWIRKWQEDGQQDPFNPSGKPAYTVRAMAHHLSWALEGRKYDENTDDEFMRVPYYTTKYGSDLYFSAW